MDSEEISLKISRDHWAFLDEIEAPMWVDLTLEANSNYTDVDDGWFHTSHLFHQCSSLQLKAAFAYSGEGSASSDIIDLKRTSSPELPSSVSRSRGKHYASKKWGGKCPDFSLNKKHPVKALSGKSTTESTGFVGNETKLSFIIQSKLKLKLVWCSSSNSGYDVQWPTFALTQQSEQTPNSRNEARMIRVMKDKVKASYASKASFVQGKGGTSNSRREGTSNASKPTQKEAANSKVQSKTLRAKALLPVRINERRSLTGPAKAKVKVAMGRPSRMVGAGSENSTGNQKCSNGDIASGVMVRGQKAAKQYLSQKDDRTGRLKGKISSPSREETRNLVQMPSATETDFSYYRGKFWHYCPFHWPGYWRKGLQNHQL
ncbi:conserved hypothetical protein [Ricinus communis]|uniref:Uncharacterized protein n=1 Tax=Ricinus communis TaxID=3988 RepID=B9S760_RICCO|nr:conserved hypothetical protein [Ricinus communis]